MKIAFEVTDHGLQIDGRGILPGSGLLLKTQPPSHWQRFGKVHQISEKQMVVATPPGSIEPDQSENIITPEALGEMDKDALAEFLRGREIEFDGRSGEEVLREIALKAIEPDQSE